LWVLVLLHIALWWVVSCYFNLFELKLCFFQCLFSLFPSLFCLSGRFKLSSFLNFLFLLDFFEFFKNVLVMQNRMCKFILKVIIIKELLYSPLDLRRFKNLMDGGTHSRIFLEHASDQIACCRAESWW